MAKKNIVFSDGGVLSKAKAAQMKGRLEKSRRMFASAPNPIKKTLAMRFARSVIAKLKLK